MEKKSTKIAYFVALGIFVVLLAILGITFKDAPIIIEDATTPFAGTFWSLLPPIVAIVLALISKEVYSSLFLGCLVGALLVSNFHPWNTLVQLVEGDNGIVTTVADSGNIAIIVFLVVLGIMVDLMNKTGGSEAFGRWAKKHVHTRCGAQLLTMLLGECSTAFEALPVLQDVELLRNILYSGVWLRYEAAMKKRKIGRSAE